MRYRLNGRSLALAATCAMALCLAACGSKQFRGNPPQQGSAQKVHLIWKQATNSWKVKLNNGPEVDPGAAKTDIAQGTGPTMFEVDIQGPTNATFKDPDGLSVWAGPKSPPQSGISSTQILGPILVTGKKMVFFDLNEGPAVTLSYALHFNNNVPSVDPIIDNGGGKEQ